MEVRQQPNVKQKNEPLVETHTHEHSKTHEHKTETKEVAEEKKKIVVVKGKKNEAVVHGNDVGISTKQAVAICNMIRNKNIDRAIAMLEEVTKMRRAVPMKGEIGHRKGKMMSGRYPINASTEFIRLLNSLKANAIYHELELEKFKIFCKSNVAPRPYRKFGRTRFKRTHVEIKLILITKKVKVVKENKK